MRCLLAIGWLFLASPAVVQAGGSDTAICQELFLDPVVKVGDTTIGIGGRPGVVYWTTDGTHWVQEKSLMFQGIGVVAVEAQPESLVVRFLGYRVPENERPVWIRWTFQGNTWDTTRRTDEVFDRMPADFQPLYKRWHQQRDDALRHLQEQTKQPGR